MQPTRESPTPTTAPSREVLILVIRFLAAINQSIDRLFQVLILYHSTTIQVGYEAVVHCQAIRQSARIEEMDQAPPRHKPPPEP